MLVIDNDQSKSTVFVLQTTMVIFSSNMRWVKFLVFLFMFVFFVSGFLVYYLASHDVILRGQKLVLVNDTQFTNACETAAANRRINARERLRFLFHDEAWFRHPKTTTTIPSNVSINETLLKLKRENALRPWQIVLEPGLRDEVIVLEDLVIISGIDKKTCGLKTGGKDFGEHHNIICYVQEKARCHLENLTLYNTMKDYPSQAIEISDGATVQLLNCNLLSQGNDTVTIRKDASLCAFGCSIRGNSDCISTHSDADIWYSYIDSRFRDGTRALWLGSKSHLYLENCILRSVNGAIEFSDVGRPDEEDQAFIQQVTLINCVLTRRSHHGRTFSVSGPLDGMFYRHDTQPPGIVHIEDTLWLESEVGASGQQYIHKMDEKKVYTTH